MTAIERFVLHPMQEYTNVSEDAPVRICCTRQCTEKRTDMNFVQVRMQNLTDRFIFHVILTIEAFDDGGEKLYELRRIILANCNAEAEAFFGEERMIALSGPIAASLTFTVECVVFDEGMLWRKDTSYRRSPVKSEAPAPVSEPSEPVADEIDERENDRTEEPAPAVKPIEKIFEFENGDLGVQPLTAAQEANAHFREIFNVEDIVRELLAPEESPIEPPEESSIEPPEEKPAPIVRQNPPSAAPVQKKRSYALLIWLLVLLGIGFAAYALYLLYINGNFSIFS